MKTRLKFKQDGIVNGKVVYESGKVYEISNETGSVDRWLKRGAEEVLEEVELSEPGQKVYVDPEVEESGVSKYTIRRHRRDSVETKVEIKESQIVEVSEVPAEVVVIDEVVVIADEPKLEDAPVTEEIVVKKEEKKENKKSKQPKVK